MRDDRRVSRDQQKQIQTSHRQRPFLFREVGAKTSLILLSLFLSLNGTGMKEKIPHSKLLKTFYPHSKLSILTQNFWNQLNFLQGFILENRNNFIVLLM